MQISNPPEAPPTGTIDEPRVFEIQDLFFSTTDKEGRIKTSNEVFVRVSGFASEELKDKPHNMIRHPDMSRVVFQLFWDEIGAGRQILAYVKNRAKDGRYYWVVALVTPIEGGYLSVRFKPSSELFPVVQSLYRELRQVESHAEAAHRGKPAAIAAGRKALDAKLLSLGFADYGAFMHHAFEREIRSREAALKNRGAAPQIVQERQGLPAAGGAAENEARRVAEACQAALTALDLLFNELEIYTKLNDAIRSKSEFVTSLSESIRMLSLNGAVEVERLGPAGSGLGKILEWLQRFSNDIRQGCEGLTKSLVQLISEIKSVVFELNAAKLQIEMTTDFARETLRAGANAGDAGPQAGLTAGAMEALYASSRGTVKCALAALAAVETNLHPVEKSQQNLSKSIRSLSLIYVQGKIELANVASERLGIVFDDVSRRLTDTEDNLGALASLIQELQKELHKGVAHREPIEQAVAKIDPGRRNGVFQEPQMG